MDEIRASEYVIKMYEAGLISSGQLTSAMDFARCEGVKIMTKQREEAYDAGRWSILQEMVERVSGGNGC